MKKRILLFTAIAGFAFVMFSSESNGPANNGWDCTGAETGSLNPAGCKGSSCHSSAATTTIGVAIELDSAGVSKHYYIPGNTYKVKITGTNGTSSTLPKFGLQLTAIIGTSAATTPTNAGIWSSSTPTGTHLKAPTATTVLNIVEHSSALSPTTGTGGTGSTIVESFDWTAPGAGTGAISFWGAVNALDAVSGAGTGDKWNTAHITIVEGPGSMTGIANVVENISVKAYPNPVVNMLTLQTDNAGAYSIRVYDLNGRSIASEQMNGTNATINTSNWAGGFYTVIAEKDGNTQVIPVVKQ